MPARTAPTSTIVPRTVSAGWCQHHLPPLVSNISRVLNGIHHTVGPYDFAALHVVDRRGNRVRGVDARVGLLPVAPDGAGPRPLQRIADRWRCAWHPIGG